MTIATSDLSLCFLISPPWNFRSSIYGCHLLPGAAWLFAEAPNAHCSYCRQSCGCWAAASNFRIGPPSAASRYSAVTSWPLTANCFQAWFLLSAASASSCACCCSASPTITHYSRMCSLLFCSIPAGLRPHRTNRGLADSGHRSFCAVLAWFEGSTNFGPFKH